MSTVATRDHPIHNASAAGGASVEGFTLELARWVASTTNGDVSASAFEWAGHVTLDWLGVTLAGASEPLVRMLDQEYAEAAPGASRVFCDASTAGVLQAALVNGAAGHALDFDDIADRIPGHPSVPVLPAVLAYAQLHPVSGRDVLRAIVIGHEVQARIGDMLGRSHYARGFHATGTIGTFGAAAAAASLMRLDVRSTANALGLAAAQAAGLKVMFGTMAKPLQAGKAAMNGLMAAQLAARGFTASIQAIEGPQGFGAALADGAAAVHGNTGAGFAIEQTGFKYHAACYLTHSTIEAVRDLRQAHGVCLDDLASMQIEVQPSHRGVCDIEDPDTGLSIKFSIRQLAVLALDGADTAGLGLYSDATAIDARYASARSRVTLVPDEALGPLAATVRLTTSDGRVLVARADIGIRSWDTAAQWRRLVEKARSMVTPVLGPVKFERTVAEVLALPEAPSVAALVAAIR